MTLIMGLDKLVTLLLVKATTFDTGKTPSTLDNLFHTQAGSELGGLMYCPRSTEYTCHATWHSYAHVNPPCQLWHTSMDVRPLAVKHSTDRLSQTTYYLNMLLNHYLVAGA